MLIRYFGAAKAASGREEEILSAGPGPDGASESAYGGESLHDLLEFLGSRPSTAPAGTPPLKSVISRSTFLVNGFAARDRSMVLAPGDTVDILPPFAGG
ncbi:MoaD/ThiS family protein [Arthrobacter sp. zg-Y1219]|uniref:MoaD/ThiS family protein n=1 Tax=Arthrobacter sp. zg-Y1219 TaxID=3049067 RepID=UPI0024C31F3E|nr:MoaD/ThiS family protein [Arthrobacter sp. zg-Y1219]MDK1360355.1 MoaD/ThiS family protein [Arthrobacter sp. zg-Y1219]